MPTIPQTKRCAACGETKPAEAFHRNKGKKDGLGTQCKACSNAAHGARYHANPEPTKARSREYERANLVQVRARQRQYRETHRAERSEQRKQLRKANAKPVESLITPDGRRCNICKVVQPAAAYSPDRKAPDGLNARCKACRRALHNANPLPKREWARKYRQTTLKAQMLADREGMRAKKRMQDRQSYWKKPEQYRNWANRRNARQRSNGGSFTAEEWKTLCARYDHRCLACGEQKRLTIDHVIPVALGGSSYIENIQPLCRECNSSKYNRHIDYRINSPYEVR